MKIPQPEVSVFCLLIKSKRVLPCCLFSVWKSGRRRNILIFSTFENCVKMFLRSQIKSLCDVILISKIFNLKVTLREMLGGFNSKTFVWEKKKQSHQISTAYLSLPATCFCPLSCVQGRTKRSGMFSSSTTQTLCVCVGGTAGDMFFQYLSSLFLALPLTHTYIYLYIDIYRYIYLYIKVCPRALGRAVGVKLPGTCASLGIPQ